MPLLMSCALDVEIELTGFFITLAILEIVHGNSPQLTMANINFLSASEHLS